MTDLALIAYLETDKLTESNNNNFIYIINHYYNELLHLSVNVFSITALIVETTFNKRVTLTTNLTV